MVRRFDVGARISQMAVHGDTAYVAGQVASDASQDVRGQTGLLRICPQPAASGADQAPPVRLSNWLHCVARAAASAR